MCSIKIELLTWRKVERFELVERTKGRLKLILINEFGFGHESVRWRSFIVRIAGHAQR